MATYSAVFSGNSAYTLYLDVTEASWDILTNSSVVNYTLRAHSDKALQYGSWDYNSGDTQYRVYINGSLVASGYKTYDFRNYKDLTVASGSTTVAHDEDGTKACAVSASYCGSGSPIGSASISKTFTLTTIPRASDITCASPVDMGTSQSVTITQKSATFSHIVYYSTDGETFTELGRDTATKTYTWTVPDISNSLPNANSATYTLKCETFLNGTYDDTPLESILEIVADVPSGYVPTVTIGTITEGNANVPAGFPFIVGHSKPTIPTTFTGSHNSTVVSRSVVLNGETLTSTAAVEPVSVTATRALSATTTPVTATVTDSRGRTGDATANITAQAYNAPTIEIDCTRCQSDGTIDPLGTYVLVLARWSWTSVTNGGPELNSADIVLKKGGTTVATYSTTTNTQTTLTQIAILSGFAITDQYTITAEITDLLVSSTVSQLVTKAQMPLSLYDDGNDIGVTIGRMATQGGFNNWLDMGLVSGNNVNLYDNNAQVIQTMTTDDLFNGGGGLAKFVKGTPIDLYDTDGTTVLYSRNPENLVFYDGQEGQNVASNFIYCHPSDGTLTTTETTIASWTTDKQRGNGFEISGGQIKCNKNGYVRVLTTIDTYVNANTSRYTAISKNGTSQITNKAYFTSYGSISSAYVMSVTSGDLISVRVKADNATSGAYSGARSYLYCEYIEDYYITNAISESNNYSTSETEIGRWIDGRPIYRKCFTVSQFPNNTEVFIPTGIQNVDYLVALHGMETNGTECFVIPSAWNTSYHDACTFVLTGANAGSMRVHTTSDRRSYSGFICIDYVKTTD